jgi:hypothetical protein
MTRKSPEIVIVEITYDYVIPPTITCHCRLTYMALLKFVPLRNELILYVPKYNYALLHCEVILYVCVPL